MEKEILSTFDLGPQTLIYLRDTEKQVAGLTVLPAEKKAFFIPEGNWKVESLVQCKRIGDNYPIGFSNGHTLRNSQTAWKLKYVSQKAEEHEWGTEILTVCESPELRSVHHAMWKKGELGVHIWCELQNRTKEPQGIEMLSSFSLCGLFSFEERERTTDFLFHRLRSVWTEEGRLETRRMTDLQLEPSWQVYGAQSIRYGQVGTMPVRRYFPWGAAEDEKYHCLIGAILSWGGSWQMELFGEDDRPAFSGGLADREFGHWMKRLEPGETLVTPPAFVASCVGDLDELCWRLTSDQRAYLETVPEQEKGMPIQFNEFCSTWGEPSEEKIRQMTAALKGRGMDYFVIDAGWYGDPVRGWEYNMGEWNYNPAIFPHGMKEAARIIREAGMTPGIWFEIENIGRDADSYQDPSVQVTRDGFPVTTERRRFFDLRKPAVREYLLDKMTGVVSEGFGYVKCDYNDNIGLGCDGAESLGEGLRQLVSATMDFYREFLRRCPVVLEICASGGHRLEPSFLKTGSLASFSDAHECVSIPIVAANVLRAMTPAQSLIWAVIRTDDTAKRVRYSMANTFLGRMCLSGDAVNLKDWQWELIEKAIALYRKAAPVIRNGKGFRLGPAISSYARPEGWQAVVRVWKGQVLAVIHSFRKGPEILTLDLEPMLEGKKDGLELADCYGSNVLSVTCTGSVAEVSGLEEMDSCILLLKNV